MKLLDEARWKDLARYNERGWYELVTSDTGDVSVRLFLSQRLFAEVEPTLYRQIVAATLFVGTRSVVITPDAHFGYGVPVGCVIATDRREGAVALGPVGFDIGCGMVSAKSNVPSEAATYDRKLAFNREVMQRVSLGAGGPVEVLLDGHPLLLATGIVPQSGKGCKDRLGEPGRRG